MKRNLLTVFFVVTFVLLITACVPRENVYEENNEPNKQNVTLYSLTETIQIDISDMQEYLSNGWYTEPVVTMYATDERTRVTLESEVEKYKEDGWYIEPVVTVYNVDGLESVILKTELETYQNNGWYTAPVATVYNADGISSVILQSEIDAYVDKGWYIEPVTKIYNIDGVESLVFQRELEHYTSNGWYTAPVITMYTADGRTSVIFESEVETYKSNGWHTEPVIIMYAEDGRTRVTLMSEIETYKKAGWFTEPVSTIGSFLPELKGTSTDTEILKYVNEHYEALVNASFLLHMGVFLGFDWDDYVSHPDATDYGRPGLYKVTEKGFDSVEDIKTYLNNSFSESYIKELNFTNYYEINGNLYANVKPFGMEGIKTYSFDSIVKNSDNTITVIGSFKENDGTGFYSYGESFCKFILENGLWKCYYIRDYQY